MGNPAEVDPNPVIQKFWSPSCGLVDGKQARFTHSLRSKGLESLYKTMSQSRPEYCGWSILSAMLRHWPPVLSSFDPAHASFGVLQCAADKTHCAWMRVPPQPPSWTCHGQAHSAAGRPFTIEMFTSDMGPGEPRFTPQVAIAPRSARARRLAMREPSTLPRMEARTQLKPSESSTIASKE